VAQLSALGILAPHQNMKTKQLANILIKILGLSVLAHGIPSILNGLSTMFQAFGSHGNYYSNYFWVYPLSSVVSVVIGIYLIVKSRDVAAFLFKDEDE
jgi:uncharacterized membrane protein HdeD (DUF308 family)